MTWLLVVVGALLVFGLYDLSRVLWLMRDDFYDIRCSISTVGHSAHKLLTDELGRRRAEEEF